MTTAEFLAKGQRWASATVLVCLVALLLGNPAQAAGPTERRAATETLVGLLLQTRECMRTGSKALLYRGVSDPNQVAVFTMRVCAPMLNRFLIDVMGWSADDAALLIVTMADGEYRRATSTL